MSGQKDTTHDAKAPSTGGEDASGSRGQINSHGHKNIHSQKIGRDQNAGPDHEISPELSDSSTSTDSNDPIERAMVEYRAAWVSGNPMDMAEFCQAHSELGSELVRKIEYFHFMLEGLPESSEDFEAAPSTEPLADDSLTGKELGDFLILNEIGRGGMGVVYSAVQKSLNRKVALKVLPAHLSFSRAAIHKFKREAEAGGKQQHLGIVSIYAVGEHKGIHYIAQELVEGKSTLADRLDELRTNGGLPAGFFRDVAKLIAKVADALKHAHDSGVIHRDIKPSNIMLTKNGSPKVTDFGLAKVEDALALSRTGDFAGTPYYMSPEQAASRRIGIDHKTDIFSLGVTLYEMLTLCRPFSGESSHEVLKKILLHEPIDPRKINSRVPRDLSVICLKAMEKKPEDRYETMQEFADDLQRYLSGDVIHARPTGAVVKAMKWSRRHQGVMAIALGVLLSLVAYITVISINSYQEAAKSATLVEEAYEALDSGDVEGAKQKLNLLIEGDMGGIEVNRLNEDVRVAEIRIMAEQEEAKLKHSRMINKAQLAASVLGESPGLAVGLAREALKEKKHAIAYSELIKSLSACLERNTLVTGPSKTIDIAPDGERILTYSTDMIVTIRNISDGSVIASLPHDDNVTFACFSHDGLFVLSSSVDGTARLWECQSWREVRSFTHDRSIRCAGISRDGRFIVTASKDLTVKLWDADTGKELRTFEGHNWILKWVTFSHDGLRIATSSEDNTVRVWDTETGETLHVFHVPGIADMVALNSDGSRLAATLRDGRVRLWELPGGDMLADIKGHESCVNSVVFSSEGDYLLTASDDNTARLWEAGNQEQIAVYKRHTAPVTYACFIPETDGVATSSNDGTIKFWDIRPGRYCPAWPCPEGLEFWSLSPTGKHALLTYKGRRQVQVWSIELGRMMRELPEQEIPLKRFAFSPDETLLATTDIRTHCVRVWNLETGEKLVSYKHNNDIFDLGFSPDNQNVISGSRDGQAKICNIFGNRNPMVLDHQREAVFSAAYHQDGTMIITISNGGMARLWDAESLEQLTELKVRDEMIHRAEVNSDHTKVVVVTRKGTAYLIDVESGEALHRFNNRQSSAFAADFSPDNSKIITFTYDGKSHIWNALDYKRLETFEHEAGFYAYPQISEQGLLVTSSMDKTVKLWDLNSLELYVSFPDEEPKGQVRVSPTEDKLVTFGNSRVVRTWSLKHFSEEQMMQIQPMTITEKQHKFILTDQEKKALRHVNSLLDDHYLPSYVISLIDDDSTLDEEVKGIALKIAEEYRLNQLWKENPDCLNEMVWLWAKDPDNHHFFSEDAIAIIENVCQDNPNHPEYLKTLGYARCRNKEYNAAVDALEKSKELQGSNRNTLDPITSTILAMAYHGAGMAKEAIRELNRVNRFVENHPESCPPDLWFYHDEAERVLADCDLMQLDPESVNWMPGTPLQDRVLFAANNDDAAKVMIYDPSSDDRSPYSELYEEEGVVIFGFELSQDQQKLFFTAENEQGESTIRAMNLQSFQVDCIKKEYFCTSDHIGLHPEGDKLYYALTEIPNEPSGCYICWIDVDGTVDQIPNKLLASHDQVHSLPTISPDGSWICFNYCSRHSAGFGRELYTAELSDNGDAVYSPVQLTYNTFADDEICISKDGEYIYWISQTQDRIRHIRRMNKNGLFKRVIRSYDCVKDPGVSQLSLSKSGFTAVAQGNGSECRVIIMDPVGEIYHTIEIDGWRTGSTSFMDG